MKKIISTFILIMAMATIGHTVYAEPLVITEQDAVFDNNFQSITSDSKISKSLSQIEELFNGKDAQKSGNLLKQIGYDVFSNVINSNSSSSGKYGNSYKLNVGEKVNIYLYGDSIDIMSISGANLLNHVTKTEVDSKGDIFVQGIGIVKAENRTVSEVESAINSLARKKYKSLKVRLSVSTANDFSVFVYGQVNRPGKVSVSNNSSIIDALNAAGGVKKTGTLRNVQYISAGKTRTIDLYKTIFLGNDENIILRANDKIFVGTIGKVVAFKNGVTVPGIYEVNDNESLKQLVKYAGGLLPITQTNAATLTRLDKDTNIRTALNVNLKNATATELNSGDIIEFRKLYNDADNIVTIQGNIKHPATFAYKEGMRLSDILRSEEELLEETFVNQAVIRRVSGTDNQITTIPVFLKEFFSGMNDPILQPKDVISIYKNTNSQFVDVYGCVNIPKHLTYKDNMTLKDVMTDIQFMESDVSAERQVNATNTVQNGIVSIEENIDGGYPSEKLQATTQNVNTLIPTENVAVEITDINGNTQLYYLYDIMINSDRIKYIKINPEDRIFFRTLRGNEVMKTVKVSGFVRNPGVYSFVEGKKLKDMIETAGGLTSEAELRGIVFTRASIKNKQVDIAVKNNQKDIKLLQGRIASGIKQEEKDKQTKLDLINMLEEDKETISKTYTGQIALNIEKNDINAIDEIDNIPVQDGDDIYIPRISNHVSVMGEVYNEQSFIYNKGAKASYYIKKVGGYTPNANKFRTYKIGANGRAKKIGKLASIQPGDTIIVPRKIAGNDWISPICNTLQGLASVFIMAFGVHKW